MEPRDTKKRAWESLDANGGWRAAIWGTALAVLASYAINSAVQSVCGFSALAGTMAELRAGGASQEEVAALAAKSMSGVSLALLVALYLEAVFRYGLAALSIAVVRGGARISHAFSGFGKGWSTMWLMALAQTYVFLWALLFVIPGIRAAFSYALVYMLKADHPEWSAGKCIAESKRLMEGNRLRYFRLWLSFAGWWILCIATFGFAVFFAIPYYNTAKAAFYEELLDFDAAEGGGEPPEETVSPDGTRMEGDRP